MAFPLWFARKTLSNSIAGEIISGSEEEDDDDEGETNEEGAEAYGDAGRGEN